MGGQYQKSAEMSGVEFGGKNVKSNAEAEWLWDLKNELNALEKQGKVKISVAMIKKHPGKMPN